ncbi:MAG: efflux RND transporter periplasmic adaptor subunit [Candidatus Saccharicenans sp.]|nr:efflux RND transporter periplasmic adaptor subunit [Candidatus Saccharicenans sp.]
MVKIETVRVESREIKNLVTANGKIVAPIDRMAVINYPFPARVNEIIVKVGEWVEKGSPLLTLQSEEAGKSRAEFFRALADLELAQANFERQKKLYERGAGAQKDYLAAEAELKVARANLEAAEKKLHLLGFSEKEVQQMIVSHQINPIVTVYSPIRGRVVEIKVIPGESVDQSKDIMTILDPRLLWVDAEIFEKDLARIKLAQKVEITVPAFPEKVFYGKVSYIGDILKEDTRTVTVRTEVDNSGMLLKPGMFASLRIQLNGDRPVLAVPAAAVCDHLGEKFVFVVRDDEFQPRKVLLGASQDGFYEVISGLQEGEMVATRGSFQLKSKLLSEVLKESIHD